MSLICFQIILIVLVEIDTDKCFGISFICQSEVIFEPTYQIFQKLIIFVEHETIVCMCDDNTVLPCKETQVDSVLEETPINQAIIIHTTPISSGIFGATSIRKKFQEVIRVHACTIIIFCMTSDWCF